jgi:hypothetical protein
VILNGNRGGGLLLRFSEKQRDMPICLIHRTRRREGCGKLVTKCSDVTLESPVVTIRITSVTITNFTFCSHSVFMCSVWISEQTVTISLYNNNWLVFITERENVYCAVRAGSLYIIQVKLTP